MNRTILSATVALAVLACGCGRQPDPRDAKIAKLESRVSALESNLVATTDLVGLALTITTNRISDQDKLLSKLEALVLGEAQRSVQMQTMLETFITSFTNQPTRQTGKFAALQTTPRPVPTTVQTKNGVPISIYTSISAEAARRYPTDYDIQAFVIKEQVEAYKKLH